MAVINVLQVTSFITALLMISLTLTKTVDDILTNNLALGKKAHQSSNHSSFRGSNAVDGTYSQTYTKCAHGNDGAGGPNWLVVDLEDFYHIHEVILTPRREIDDTSEASNRETPPRMQYVYVGITHEFNNPNLTPVRHNYTLCRQWPYETDISKNLSITCRPNTPPGRYVIVQQPIDGPGMLTICEIQIFGEKLKQDNGECINGYYGEQCDKQCNCFKQIGCFKSNGTCQSDCDENWEGPTCNRRRADYEKLRVGCFVSNINHSDAILTPRYTKCVDQCSGNGFNFASVWNETSCYCTNHIDWSSLTDNCKNSCAENISKECITSNGNILLSVCPNGTYGYNCTLRCNCLNNERCWYLNGSCNQGCKSGWIGDSCNIRDCKSNNGDCESREICLSSSNDISSCVCNTTIYHRKHLWLPCEDIDECQMNNSCEVDEVCKNFDGGYDCISKAVGLNEVIYIVIALATIIILLVAVLLFLKFKRRHNLNYTSTANSSDYVASSSSGIRNKVTDLYLDDFPSYVVGKKQLIEKEFKELSVVKHPVAFAQNQPKYLNRFKNIVPYDNNRVELKAVDQEASDYINASYIKNVLPTTLIATQGPTAESVESFWRMIYQESIGIIVMLCNFVEMAKPKCAKYLPVEGSESYGNIKITKVNSCDWPEYKVTRLILEKEGNEYEITHLHYLKWPDHEAPKYISYFLAFNRHFRKLYGRQKCGVVVHCSAGVGRTGSFIAVTELVTRALAGQPVNVSRCVNKLRESRMKMVEKEAQFAFIYDCLAVEASLGQTNFDPQEFQKKFKDNKFMKKMENQYQHLQTLLDKRHFKESNFIEVVTSTRKFYLIRQKSVNGFWSEIPKECDLVIVLGQQEEYFPDCDQSIDTGSFVISLVSEETNLNGNILNLQMFEKSDSVTYANTPIYENNENLANPVISRQITAILVQREKTEETEDCATFIEIFRMTKPNSLTCLMFSCERLAGFFMTACNVLDQMLFRDEVAVFQNVLEIQSQSFRYDPMMVDYIKLHELVMEYLKEEKNNYPYTLSGSALILGRDEANLYDYDLSFHKMYETVTKFAWLT